MAKKGLGKFICGAAIGAGLGVLFAPKKGEETRKELKAKMDELLQKAKEIDLEDLKDDIECRIEELKNELADLDKEKALKIAKKKGAEIMKKADDLVKLAVKKGTPIVEKAAEDVRIKTIDVLESTIKKLEKETDKKTK